MTQLNHAHHETWPRTLRCKGSADVLLRPMEPADIDTVRQFFFDLPRSDRLFLRYDVTNPAALERWVLHTLGEPRHLRLLAFHGDEMVGHGLLEPDRHVWSPHVGEVRVLVRERFKRRSLGSLILRELVDQASLRNFDKLTIRLMDTQIAVRKMCERAGFSTEAEFKAHVKDLDGKKHNMIVMSCSLDDAWHAMELLLEDVAPWSQ